VVARNLRVVLVDFAVARPPVIELGTRDAEPADQTGQRQLGALVQRGQEVDDDIAEVVGTQRRFRGPQVFFLRR
jgi:hypothetical protein